MARHRRHYFGRFTPPPIVRHFYQFWLPMSGVCHSLIASYRYWPLVSFEAVLTPGPESGWVGPMRSVEVTLTSPKNDSLDPRLAQNLLVETTATSPEELYPLPQKTAVQAVRRAHSILSTSVIGEEADGGTEPQSKQAYVSNSTIQAARALGVYDGHWLSFAMDFERLNSIPWEALARTIAARFDHNMNVALMLAGSDIVPSKDCARFAFITDDPTSKDDNVVLVCEPRAGHFSNVHDGVVVSSPIRDLGVQGGWQGTEQMYRRTWTQGDLPNRVIVGVQNKYFLIGPQKYVDEFTRGSVATVVSRLQHLLNMDPQELLSEKPFLIGDIVRVQPEHALIPQCGAESTELAFSFQADQLVFIGESTFVTEAAASQGARCTKDKSPIVVSVEQKEKVVRYRSQLNAGVFALISTQVAVGLRRYELEPARALSSAYARRLSAEAHRTQEESDSSNSHGSDRDFAGDAAVLDPPRNQPERNGSTENGEDGGTPINRVPATRVGSK